MSKIKRRNLLKYAATAAFGASLGAYFSFPTPAISKNTNKITLLTLWPKDMLGLGNASQRLAKRITTLSAGKIIVELDDQYAGNSDKVFELVSSGEQQMCYSFANYWLDKNPAFTFFGSMPAGLIPIEQNAWLYYGGGQNLWDSLYSEYNLKPFLAGNIGIQMGGWFNKEINAVEDFKGLKIRFLGLGSKIVEKLGGTSVTVNGIDLVQAMENHTIDSCEWIGPWNDLALGLHKVSKYYYGPAFHEGGSIIETILNKNFYDNLPQDLQLVFKTACAAETNLVSAQYHYNNINSLKVLRDKINFQIKCFPEHVSEELFKISSKIVAEVIESNETSKKIFECYHRFLKSSIYLAGFTELGFLKARSKIFNI